jgi:hypothetical protein
MVRIVLAVVRPPIRAGGAVGLVQSRDARCLMCSLGLGHP